MLRDKNLVPLSHQHQHVLALCVRLDRALGAGEVDLDAWQVEIAEAFQSEIAIHFSAEEKEIFPAASAFPELKALVADLLAEHKTLRDFFDRSRLRNLSRNDLAAFVVALSHHIRKEERELFEGMQAVMNRATLSALGAALEQELKHAHQACRLRKKS